VPDSASGADFHSRFSRLADQRSPFCLGIDPTSEVLKAWGVADSIDGLSAFCDKLVAICGSKLAMVKPQSAYFERFGAPGIGTLKKLTQSFQQAGTLVLIDAKRGDIGSTNEAYARTYFGDDSYFKADATTVSPYLGFDALRPIYNAAAASNAGVFVVTASSNPEGAELQTAKLESGLSVAESIAEKIAAFNATHGKVLGAVVGATRTDATPEFLARFSGALLLCPGIGAQGATYEGVKGLFKGCAIVPTSARAVLMLGGDRAKIHGALDQHAKESAALWRNRQPTR
jgi:orotidine-5'-phosphate decarboxylase